MMGEQKRPAQILKGSAPRILPDIPNDRIDG